jgi:hypothetical protein
MIKLSSKRHKHEHVMMNNGQPPEKALFKSKAGRTELGKRQELTSSSKQDKIWYERNFTRDAHIPPPHLKFALLGNKTQVCGDQASFCKFPHQIFRSVAVDEAHMFLGITCPPFLSIFT